MKWQLYFQILSLMFFGAMLVIAVINSVRGKK